MMFKTGQQIICISPNISGEIKYGKIYTVKKVVKNKFTGKYGVQLNEASPSSQFLYFKAERFKPVQLISTL